MKGEAPNAHHKYILSVCLAVQLLAGRRQRFHLVVHRTRCRHTSGSFITPFYRLSDKSIQYTDTLMETADVYTHLHRSSRISFPFQSPSVLVQFRFCSNHHLTSVIPLNRPTEICPRPHFLAASLYLFADRWRRKFTGSCLDLRFGLDLDTADLDDIPADLLARPPPAHMSFIIPINAS